MLGEGLEPLSLGEEPLSEGVESVDGCLVMSEKQKQKLTYNTSLNRGKERLHQNLNIHLLYCTKLCVSLLCALAHNRQDSKLGSEEQYLSTYPTASFFSPQSFTVHPALSTSTCTIAQLARGKRNLCTFSVLLSF